MYRNQNVVFSGNNVVVFLDYCRCSTCMYGQGYRPRMRKVPFRISWWIWTACYISAPQPASLADRQLWKSDGTLTGTVMVSSMNPGWEIVAMNGHVYFRADDGGGAGSELWRSDGTTTEMGS